MPKPKLRHVVVVCFPDAQLLDITGPAQVFATAAELAPPGAGVVVPPPAGET